VGHDFIEDFRGAILHRTDDAEQHTAGDATPGAILQPRLAFLRLLPFALTLTQRTCREARGLCRKVGFWRPNPKFGYQKINDLRVSTFLFSVICDRADYLPG
jgi:hypothetical protein